MIPKIIHQTWKSLDQLSPSHRMCRQKNLVLNSWWNGWQHRFVKNIDCRKDVQQFRPDLLPLFDGFAREVQGYDLWRLVVIEEFGGFYMDIDMEPVKPLDPLCVHSCVLGKETPEKDIANYMFGAAPNHPFIKEVLVELQKRVEEMPPANSHEDIYVMTGPVLWRSVYEQSQARDDVVLLHHPHWQRFGEYAIHHYEGTWKWTREH